MKELIKFNMDAINEKIKSYVYDENQKLVKFGFANPDSINIEHEYSDITDARNRILTRIKESSTIHADIEEATKQQMLDEIDLQIQAKEEITKTLEESIKYKGEQYLDLLKDIFSDDKNLLEIIKRTDKDIYKAFTDKYDYCEKCKKFTEINKFEEEVYSESADDYILKGYSRCNECFENY